MLKFAHRQTHRILKETYTSSSEVNKLSKLEGGIKIFTACTETYTLIFILLSTVMDLYGTRFCMTCVTTKTQ